MRLARIVAGTWSGPSSSSPACARRKSAITPSAPTGHRSAPPESPRFTVRVGPASVPETLDRPELVLRVSATELVIDDSHHWAEPLRSGIARAVAGGLARRAGRRARRGRPG